MDVRFIEIDQEMPVMLSACQQILNPFHEGLPPPRRIGSTEQLLGLLPRELQAEQGRSDRLAATDAEPRAHPADQTPQRPARRRIRPCYGRRCRRALGGADRRAEFGLLARAKK